MQNSITMSRLIHRQSHSLLTFGMCIISLYLAFICIVSFFNFAKEVNHNVPLLFLLHLVSDFMICVHLGDRHDSGIGVTGYPAETGTPRY